MGCDVAYAGQIEDKSDEPGHGADMAIKKAVGTYMATDTVGRWEGLEQRDQSPVYSRHA